jgi:hypothetical protein
MKALIELVKVMDEKQRQAPGALCVFLKRGYEIGTWFQAIDAVRQKWTTGCSATGGRYPLLPILG